MATQLNDISLIINNNPVAYEADSLKWRDGFGEYSCRNAVVGGGQTLKIFSKDLKSKFGMVSFALPSTAESEALKREFKINNDQNTIELIGPEGLNFSKTFTQACLTTDPETSAAVDGQIECEFSTDPAV